MIQVEQTEFWSDVDTPPSGPAASVTYSRRGDTVYVDETASLTDWFLEDDEDPTEPTSRTEPEPPLELPAPMTELAAAPAEAVVVTERGESTEIADPVPPPSSTITRPVPAPTVVPTFNMARFLTLTGSLDSVEEEGRYLVLPRRGFRPHVVLDAVRRISRDFLKDLRSPPRNYSISPYQRPSGWMRL